MDPREHHFFVFAPMRFDSTRARKHGFADALARKAARGVYVEFPGSRSRYHEGRGTLTLNAGAWDFGLRPPADAVERPGECGVLAVPRKWGLGPIRIGSSERRAAPRIAAWLGSFFASYRKRHRAPLAAIVSTARWTPMLRGLDFDLMVYDKTDVATSLKGRYSIDEYATLETELIARCRLLVAASLPLAAELEERCGRHVPLVANGVDLGRFHAGGLKPAPELDGLPRPRCGIVATITDWTDTHWLAAAAREFPEWSFPIIGPVNDRADMKPLQGLRNVVLLGKQPGERVPEFVAGLDLCLHLLREGPVREANRSTKVWEYLALGKPMVCSWIPGLEDLEPLIYRCRDLPDFLGKLRVAASEHDAERVERRRLAAAANTWDRRIEEVFGYLQAGV